MTVERIETPDAFASQRARDVGAAPVGQADVEDDAVIVVGTREQQPVGRVGRRVDRVPLLAEDDAHQVAHVLVVLDHQNLHPSAPGHRPFMN